MDGEVTFCSEFFICRAFQQDLTEILNRTSSTFFMTAKLLWCYFEGHNILNNTTIRTPQKMVAVGNDALVKSPVSRDTSCRKFQPWQPVATRSSPEVDFETTNHLQRLGHHRCHLWLLGSGGRWGRH